MKHKCENKRCQGVISRPGKCQECARIWAATLKTAHEALERERELELTKAF